MQQFYERNCCTFCLKSITLNNYEYYQLNLKLRQLIQYLYNEERLLINKISERLKINKSRISLEIKETAILEFMMLKLQIKSY